MDFKLSREHEMLRKSVRDYVKKEVAPTAAERDEEARFDRGIMFDKLAELELTGIIFPEKYGGVESDYLSYVIAVEELSKACASTGVTLSAHTSLCSKPIYLFGTEEQKEKFLKPLAEGKKMGCLGLTEPEAGSDAGGTQATAKLEGDEWVLNGSKNFITNGGEAEINVALFRTEENAEKKHKGISAFIVESDAPGFSVGKKEDKLGIRSSPTRELVFNNCRVPRENLLGEQGEGFKIAMKTLDGGRIGIAAQALGIAQGAYEEALNYAKKRKQFGTSITNFQAIQFKFADMATQIDAARLLVYRAAFNVDSGMPYTKEAAMAKMYASDVAMWATTEAVQILGGYGYVKDYPVERMMRDAKITQIYEGTNEIQRVVIGSNIMK
ncbi:MAG: acyl-CoA dehydrogenase [Thermodesulfobacteriota bacterium]